jgi:hypothetical protein
VGRTADEVRLCSVMGKSETPKKLGAKQNRGKVK